jgi:hypothetical protein
MAIQCDVALPSGLTAPTAYVRVSDILIKKTPEGAFRMTYGFQVYVSAQARVNLVDPAWTSRHACAYDDAQEAYAQAYTNLKATYPGASDV